jgi:indolepyruvate ferredoxin oxidoreductase beta subunit
MRFPKGHTFNLIIAGTGGQGNIMVSKLLGEAAVKEGCMVTIGETYGASQRGGSVASHVRISRKTLHGPLVPEGAAHLILGLEPVEALRMLALVGGPRTTVITNVRPIHPMSVAMGEARYPAMDEIKAAIASLSQRAVYLDAFAIANDLGLPLLGNMVMAGALIGSGLLPVPQEGVERRIGLNFQEAAAAQYLKALRLGAAAVKAAMAEDATHQKQEEPWPLK